MTHPKNDRHASQPPAVTPGSPGPDDPEYANGLGPAVWLFAVLVLLIIYGSMT